MPCAKEYLSNTQWQWPDWVIEANYHAGVQKIQKLYLCARIFGVNEIFLSSILPLESKIVVAFRIKRNSSINYFKLKNVWHHCRIWRNFDWSLRHGGIWLKFKYLGYRELTTSNKLPRKKNYFSRIISPRMFYKKK